MNSLERRLKIITGIIFGIAVIEIVCLFWITNITDVYNKEWGLSPLVFKFALGLILIISLYLFLYLYRGIKKINTQLQNFATIETPRQFNFVKELNEQIIAHRWNDTAYSALIEQATEAIYVIDVEGNFVHANTSMCKMLGYTYNELIGMTIEDIIDPEELKTDPVKYGQDTIVQGEIKERRFVRKDETIFHVETTIKTFKEGWAMAIAKDITRQKEIEAQLKNAELKFRTLAEKSLVGVYIIQNGKYAYVNPKLAEIFGYQQHELINTVSAIILIHEDHQGKTDEYLKKRLANEVESVHYEAMGRRKDGKIIWLEIYGSRVDLDNVPTIIGSAIDVTERKKNEDLIIKEKVLSETIIKSLPGIFYLQNDKGRLLRWNNNLEVLSGYTPEEIATIHGSEMIAPEDKPRVREAVIKAFTRGYTTVEVNGIDKLGKRRPFLLRGLPINYENQTCLLGIGMDISSRVRAEEALKLSEQKYKFLFENNPSPMLVWDFETRRIIDCNEEAVLKYGYTRDEFLGLTIHNISADEDISLIEEAIRTPEEYGRIHKQIWRHKKKNGTIISVEVNAHLINYNNRLVSINQNIDITEKLKAEEELLASEERYKLLFYNSPLPMWVYTTESYQIIDVNDVAIKNYGYSRDEFLNMTIHDIRPRQDIPFMINVLKNMRHDHGVNHFGIFNHLKKDKTIIKVDVSAYQFNYRGKDCIMSVCNDVTDRQNTLEQLKENEIKLLNAQKIARLGNWSYDTENQSVYWSDEIFRIYGVTKSSFVSSFESYFNSIHPDDQNTFLELWNNVLKGEIKLDFEHRIILPDSSIKWVHELGRTIKDDNGKPISFEGSVQDITAQKTLSLSLEKSEKSVRKFAKRLSDLLEEDRAHIAREIHDEFGQQLSGLKMSLASLKKANSANDETAHLVDTLIKDVNHSIQCLRQIANELRPVIIDKLGLVEAIKWLLSEFEKKHGISCQFHLDTDQRVINKVLEIHIFRILQEALTNVTKHAMATKVDIWMEHNNGYLIIKTIDDGRGIEDSDIHDPLSMGLLNMRERAILIGAEINITSVYGSGTTIELIIKTDDKKNFNS